MRGGQTSFGAAEFGAAVKAAEDILTAFGVAAVIPDGEAGEKPTE